MPTAATDVAPLIDPAWMPFITAIAAVVVTVLGALLGARLQASREHVRWIRQERLKAYTEVLAAVDLYVLNAQKLGTGFALSQDKADRLHDEMQRSGSLVALLGPEVVRKAASALRDDKTLFVDEDSDTIDYAATMAAREVFITAARLAIPIEESR